MAGGTCSHSDIEDGLEAVTLAMQSKKRRGVVILAISFTYLDSFYKTWWDTRLESLTQAGGILVTSSGNQQRDACRIQPAFSEYAITVGALEAVETMSALSGSALMEYHAALYSNYGKCVDVWGPGTNIVSACAGSDVCYEKRTGTSMAVPWVAGVVATYLMQNNDLTLLEIRSKLRSKRGSVNVHGKCPGAKPGKSGIKCRRPLFECVDQCCVASGTSSSSSSRCADHLRKKSCKGISECIWRC